MWIMPVSLLLGLVVGVLTRAWLNSALVDQLFSLFLIVLYICVGISQGANRDAFKYVKALGLKILWLPLAILIGSLLGGLVSGIVLNIPQSVSMVSAGA